MGIRVTRWREKYLSKRVLCSYILQSNCTYRLPPGMTDLIHPSDRGMVTQAISFLRITQARGPVVVRGVPPLKIRLETLMGIGYNHFVLSGAGRREKRAGELAGERRGTGEEA
jgi:hypothetical protein